MSSFVQHHPCPKCGSSDALAEFSDGHYHCFSCKHFIPSKVNSLEGVARVLNPQEKLDWKKLPDDASKNYSLLALRWLKTYGLTNDEIESNLLWSDRYEMLLFPFYGNENELLCWQGRYFPQRNPKVYTAGYPDNHILIRGNWGTNVVVVEDSISAIKVSRVMDSSELLGCNLSLQKVMRLSRLYENLYIWLDSDKLSVAIKFKEKYGTLFKNIEVIYSDKDPKEYSTEEIRNHLSVGVADKHIS
jgi:hypothetical protein